MRILLDTHVWLWMIESPDRLNKRALKILRKQDNELLLSAVSAWEISIKHSLGRIDLGGAPAAVIPRLMRESDVLPLSIAHAHGIAAGLLPRHHADPFDRMLVAQAQLEGLPLLTADEVFALYDVEVLPAA